MHVSVLSALILLVPMQTVESQQKENPPPAIRATGIGRPPRGRPAAQSRLMARRAAQIVAVRNLAREVGGLEDAPAGGTGRMTSTTTIRGFRYVSSRLLPDGRGQVTVELPLTRYDGRDRRLAGEKPAVDAWRVRAEALLAAADARLESLNRRTAARVAEIERELSAAWRAFRTARKPVDPPPP